VGEVDGGCYESDELTTSTNDVDSAAALDQSWDDTYQVSNQ